MRATGNKAAVGGFIRLTYNTQITSLSTKFKYVTLGARQGSLTERFVDKGRILYSNDDGLLSTAALTLTQVKGIIPR